MLNSLKIIFQLKTLVEKEQGGNTENIDPDINTCPGKIGTPLQAETLHIATRPLNKDNYIIKFPINNKSKKQCHNHTDQYCQTGLKKNGNQYCTHSHGH